MGGSRHREAVAFVELVSELLTQIKGLRKELGKLRDTTDTAPGRRTDGYFNLTAAAEYTSLSRETIRLMITEEGLPFMDMGKGKKPYYLLRKRDLDNWLSGKLKYE